MTDIPTSSTVLGRLRARLPPRTDRRLLVVIAEAFLARLGFSVITFALPFYALSLGLNLGETGLLIAFRIISAIAFKPVMGIASDRFGSRTVYVWSIAGRCLVALLFTLTYEPWHLFAVRALQGVTSAAREPASALLLIENADQARVASTFSWYASSRSIGIAMGYPLAGLMLALSGDNYPLVFLFTAATSALAFVMVWRLTADDAPAAGATQTTDADPVSPTPPLAVADWLPYAALALAMAVPAGMVQSLFPLIVAARTGLGKIEIGVIYTVSMAVVVVAGPLLGFAADTISRRLVLAIRSLASILSSVLYCVLPGFWGMTGARMVDDIGRAAYQPAWGSVMGEVSRGTDPRRRGRLVAYLDTAESIGEAAGPILAGVLWQYGTIYWLFGVRIALSVVAEILAVRTLRRITLAGGATTI